MTFNKVAAEVGGGLSVYNGSLNASQISLIECTAQLDGAVAFVRGSAVLQNVSAKDCAATTSGSVVTASGDLHVASLATSSSDRQWLNAAGAAVVGSWDCGCEETCAVRAEKGAYVTKMSCLPGTGVRSSNESSGSIVGCFACHPGTFRLGFSADYSQCDPCPEFVEVCLPTELKMPFGMSLGMNATFSFSALRCPNPSACIGGRISSKDLGLWKAKTIFPAMCEKGYVGEACFQCAQSHGMADNNPLKCQKCPSKSTYSAARSMAFYIGKDVALFLSATINALSASSVKRKQSAVLLNQLLAFATVSNIICAGVSQTGAYRELMKETRDLLEKIEFPVNFAQVQGDGAVSKQCLLRHLGIPDALGYVHLFSLLVPLSLMAMLAWVKEPRLSLVVGTNVFLPAFTAAFGKYLIAFRTKHGSKGGQLEMPFLPGFGFTLDMVAISSAILLCFLLSIAGWLLLTRSTEKDGGVPQHILYLIQSYKPESRSWEIERLIRKMILAFITCAIPVSYSPTLQMEAVSLTLITSLILYTMLMPFKETWPKLVPFWQSCILLTK